MIDTLREAQSWATECILECKGCLTDCVNPVDLIYNGGKNHEKKLIDNQALKTVVLLYYRDMRTKLERLKKL